MIQTRIYVKMLQSNGYRQKDIVKKIQTNDYCNIGSINSRSTKLQQTNATEAAAVVTEADAAKVAAKAASATVAATTAASLSTELPKPASRN